jgi:phage virion morphogenesis protein
MEERNNIVEITGVEAINAKLAQLQNTLTSAQMQKKMNTLGGMVLNSIEESFASQQSPFGDTWDPRKKSKTNQSTLVLRDEGNLSDKWVVNATDKGVIVSNNSAWYGIVHQKGTDKAGRGGKTKIPKRPFLPINEAGDLEPTLKKDMISYLEDAIEKILS